MRRRLPPGATTPRRPFSLGISLLCACTMLVAPSKVLAQSRDQTASTTRQTAGVNAISNSRLRGATGIDDTDSDQSPLTTATTKKRKPLATDDDATTTLGVNERARRLTGLEEDTAADTDFGRMNLRETSVDGLSPKTDANRDQAPGIRLGTMLLRPSITQSIATESTREGGRKENRTYLQTGLKGSLTSDWSRHALTVTGDGTWQRNIGGTGETEPSANIDADLRLDLARETTVNISGGYSFSREDADDPNAISGASSQAGVHSFTGGIAAQRDFGVIRGTTGLQLEKRIYTDAELADGTKISLRDRDRLSGTLRGRIGYELSPALIPFMEASVGRSRYDLRTDRLGYERSSWTYAGKLGVEVDLGEKLRGELGVGYEKAVFDDDQLKALDGASIDGTIAWSPQRGTDVTVGLSTNIEPSTTAGESGYIAYAANAGLTHEVREYLLARLIGSATLRDYPSGGSQDETVYLAGTGLTWGINRYLDLTGDISYEMTARKTNADTQILRAGIGLTLKR